MELNVDELNSTYLHFRCTQFMTLIPTRKGVIVIAIRESISIILLYIKHATALKWYSTFAFPLHIQYTLQLVVAW